MNVGVYIHVNKTDFSVKRIQNIVQKMKTNHFYLDDCN